VVWSAVKRKPSELEQKRMALKRKLVKLEEVAEGLRPLYVERDGAFHLDAEEDPRIAEMRDSAIAARKEALAVRESYAGLDAAGVKKLQEEKARLEDEQRIKDGKVAEVIAEHVRKALAPVTEERDRLSLRLSSVLIDNAVVTEGTKRGLRASAVADLTARARNVFRLVDGSPRAVGADGQPLMSKAGTAPLSLAEWVDALGTEAPHLFEANAGAGGAGSGSGGAGTGGTANPWRKDTWNVTEQMALLRRDPARAAALEAAAKQQ
jgi:hypothetical protein